MLKKISLFLFVLIATYACQTTKKNEINFENKSFNELLAKASKENKLIFIDCYTSWCAPCKWMDKNVFNKQEVADFYNENFINLKLDMEKGEGINLAKKYQVNSFPTYLYINATGKVIHRANSRMSLQDFIGEGEKALNPSLSIGVLAEKHQQKIINQNELVTYAIALKNNRNSSSKKILQEILNEADSVFYASRNGWKVVQNFIFDDSILENKFNENQDFYVEQFTQEKVDEIHLKLLQRKLYAFSRDHDSIAFFNSFKTYKKLNPPIRDLAIVHSGFYRDQNNAEGFIKVTNSYLKALDTDPETIAFIARSANNFSKNSAIVNQAAKLISIAYKKRPLSYGTTGTYASIQNRIGNKKEAITAAELAVKMADTISSKIKKLALQNLENIKNNKTQKK